MKRGSVTVFLAMILPLFLVLELILVEAARTPALRYMQEQAGEAATDSLLAGYTRELFDDYGILLLEGGYGKPYLDVSALEEAFLASYKANRKESEKTFTGSLFGMREASAALSEVVTATDYQGAIFVDNVLEFFSYDFAGAMLETIKNQLNLFSQGENAKAEAEGAEDERQNTDWEHYGETSEALNENNSAFDGGQYNAEVGSSIIGGVEKVKAKGWLSLVIPAGTSISGIVLDNSSFPSILNRDDREPEDSDTMTNPVKKVAFCEYILQHFTNYTNAKSNGNLQYGIEYVLYGNVEDKANLQTTLNRIMWIREGMNLLALYKDSVKREMAMQVAELLIGWSGIVPLVLLVQTAILASWAYAEALLDVKTLLKGEKVPLVKDSSTWTLSLEGASQLLSGSDIQAISTKEGLAYGDYLRILLYLTDFSDIAYRTMDLVQCSYQKTYPNYRLCNAIDSFSFRVTTLEKPIIARVPILRNTLGIVADYLTVNTYSGQY